MALLAVTKTWSAGDKLTATDLNAEFVNIIAALSGSGTENLKVVYANADLPNLELYSTANNQVLLKLHATGTTPKGLVMNDGASDVAEITGAGLVKGTSLESTVATGTAPLVVASTTVVTNLNASTLEGNAAADFLSGTGNQTITRNGANLVWTWQSDSGVKLVIDDTGSAYSYTIQQTLNKLDFLGDATTLFSLDAANTQVEIAGELDLQANVAVGSNNSATIKSLADGTMSWDLDDGSVAEVTLDANSTLTTLTNAKIGGTYMLIVKQGAAGGKTLSLGANFLFAGGTNPTITAAANSVDILTILAEDSSTFYVTAVQNLQ